MKILITGAGGMLAQDMFRMYTGICNVVAVTHADLDLTNAGQTERLVAFYRPEYVINCAGYTDVDGCETQCEAAFRVNASGAKNIALACRNSGSQLVHISTDYVFDGDSVRPYTEEDQPNPLSVYGRTKLAGERYVRDICDNYLIVRTAWLYGRAGAHFVGKILQRARTHATIEVVDDQRGSPTFTVDLSAAIHALLLRRARGVYHITNAGSCSWFVFAQRILALSGSACRVQPISSSGLARPAQRPAHAVLDGSKFITATGHRLRTWQQALSAYLLERPEEYALCPETLLNATGRHMHGQAENRNTV